MKTIMPHLGVRAPFPVDERHRQFPSLARAGSFVFFDNPAGAQVPDRVLNAAEEIGRFRAAPIAVIDDLRR
jgi:selenocysteine lyase/cysteine desulfurase